MKTLPAPCCRPPDSLQTHSHSPSPLLSRFLKCVLTLVLFLRSPILLAPRSRTPRASQRNFPGVGTRCHHHPHHHHHYRQRYQHYRYSTTTDIHRAVTFVFSTFTNTDNEILYTSMMFHHHQIHPSFHSNSPRLDTGVSLSFVYPTLPSLVLLQVSHNFSTSPPERHRQRRRCRDDIRYIPRARIFSIFIPFRLLTCPFVSCPGNARYSLKYILTNIR